MDLAIEGNHESTVLMLLSLQNWKQSLASKIYRNGKIMTPLRRMILKMPNAASVTFDKMITNYEKQKFSFDFQFIDDTFSSNLWADGYQNFNDRENFKKQYQGQVFNDTGELDSIFKARPVRYSNDTQVIIDNHPLSLMAKNKRSKLILHPLVTQVELLNFCASNGVNLVENPIFQIFSFTHFMESCLFSFLQQFRHLMHLQISETRIAHITELARTIVMKCLKTDTVFFTTLYG